MTHNKPACKPRLFTSLLSLGLCCFGLASGVRADEQLQYLKNLSLDDLANIEVSIASKTPQKAGDAAAAVFVVTSDDIRRSGATSIPELLRAVPGLHVARIDGNQWAISARGFNGRFANKLLVLMDGRTVYTPLFSGVYWEEQDTLLADIERIEVVRGPGAAVWGANAVNAVINIITKKAGKTQGGLLYNRVGTEERVAAGGRYGGKLGDDIHYRVYSKYFERNESELASGNHANDDRESLRAGFRVDWQVNDNNNLTLQGDIYDGEAGQAIAPSLLDSANGSEDSLDDRIDFSGGNLLARWVRDLAAGAQEKWRLYYDRAVRTKSATDGTRDTLDTLDIEYQRQLAPLGRHNMIGGLGYRYTRDDFPATDAAAFSPESSSLSLFSAFLQDDIRLLGEKVFLTLGSRFEHNDFTGFEIQPSVRLRWHTRADQLLWAAVSRAVRTPGRAERQASVNFGTQPPSPESLGLPVEIRLTPNSDYDSESLIAYELGYRWQAFDKANLDLALFYNDYDDLRTIEFTEAQFSPIPAPHIDVVTHTGNNMQGKTYGAELAMDWRINDWWRMRANWSLLKMDLKLKDGSTDRSSVQQEDETPEQQFGLYSSMTLGPRLEFDLSARYVDRVQAFDIDAYTALNARLGWTVNRNLDLSFVAQNVLQDSHPEYRTTFVNAAETEVERSFYLQLNWRF